MEHEVEYQEICRRLAEGNPPASDSGIFGASFSEVVAKVVILGVPWDVTCSGQPGTAGSIPGLLRASHDIDHWDHQFGPVYEKAIRLEVMPEVNDENDRLRPLAESVLASYYDAEEPPAVELDQVNQGSMWLNDKVYSRSMELLALGKKVCVLGGDHSTPFGLLKALGVKHSYGILHIDAHHDLRKEYCGFTHSHASIFYNALKELSAIKRLVSVGIRDYSQFEVTIAQQYGQRVKTYYGPDLFARMSKGVPWHELSQEIIEALPDKVYLSVDIDGLDPSVCPGTGTPVPGGLSFEELSYLFFILHESGKEVIGFDLVEVGGANGSSWDQNVGARILYKLCGLL